MNSLSLRKELFLSFLLAAYCIYYLTVSLYAAWGFTTDDAYISWLYARQLVQGSGLYWHHLMPPVEGYSNFLWVMIAAFVIKMHWPLALVMKWISVSSLGLGLIFLYRFARLFFTPLLAMLPVFLVSHYMGLIWWTVSGLESAFFCALSIALAWQCAMSWGYGSNSLQIKRSTRSWIMTNLFLLLLALTRFEGLIWIIPVSCFSFCQLKSDDKPSYRWGIITGCCFLIPYAVYFIWRFHYFGHWFPNSYRCKALVDGQVGIVDLDYLKVIIPFIVISLPYFLSKKDCRHLLLWLPSVLYGLMLWKADPILAHRLRLFFGPFALFSLLPVLGVRQFLEHFNLSNQRIKTMTSLVIMAFTFIFIPGSNLPQLRILASDFQDRNQSRINIAKLLNTQAKQGATVLLGDCGLIPFNTRSDIHFIDSLCLNNPQLTQMPFKNNKPLYAQYLHDQVKPDWVIVSKSIFVERGDEVIGEFEKKDFLKSYHLVATWRSGAILPGSLKKTIDTVYLVYSIK